jgi:hypothetical protein
VKSSTKYLPPSKLRKLRGSEQVAAVCYRVRGESLQFLLVRTGGKRWTFPKGCAEPGLTHAQAAALEAFEEAGIHGCMEETCFTRYTLRSGKKAAGGLAVNAYLCKVMRQVSPEESQRKPSWFSPEDCKRRLKEGRTVNDGREFARVVDDAIDRIQERSLVSASVRNRAGKRDALQNVPFEAVDVARTQAFRQASFLDFLRHRAEPRQIAPLTHSGRRFKRLALSATPQMARVVEIDNPHGAHNRIEISTKKTR